MTSRYASRSNRQETHQLDTVNTTRSMIWPAYLIISAALIGLSLFAYIFMKHTITATFLNNIAMNGMIVGTFFSGLIVSLMPLGRMSKDFRWIKNHLRNIPRYDYKPSYLTKFSVWFLKGKDSNSQNMSSNERSQALLDAENRLFNARETPKYFIGMLIFLGLLGTLWGLSQTIRSVSHVISTLPMDTHSMISFQTLKNGLKEPLSGMGTAFGCSMFGLAGSLILGFIELIVKQTQQKFFFYVETATAHLERGTSPALSQLKMAQTHPEYLIKVLEFMAENLELLNTNEQARTEHNRQIDRLIMTLCDKVSSHMEVVHDLSQSTHDLAQSAVATQGVVDSLKVIEEEMAKSTRDQQRHQVQFLDAFKKEMRLMGKILHRENLIDEEAVDTVTLPEPSTAIKGKRSPSLRSRTEFIR